MNTVYLLLILALGGYIGHINILKNAVAATTNERNSFWENRFKVTKAEYEEKSNAIVQAYVNRTDSDVDVDFTRVFGNATGNHCDCSGKLQTDTFGPDSGQDQFAYGEGRYTYPPPEDTDLSEEELKAAMELQYEDF